MVGIDILNNGLRSLTGAVTKAYIKFEDERISANDVNVTEVRARAAALPPGIPGADKLMAVAQKAAGAANSLANALGGLMAGVGLDLFSSGNVYEVKFNPSEMSFQAYGGGNVQRMNLADPGAEQKVSIEFVEMKPRIMLNVPLIFDDYERTDAFMMEKFSDPTAMARTVVTSVANTLTGNTYSVRPQVEGFVAALRNKKTRKITFFWGNMEYKGILEMVSAEYTMFNMEGHPIRATVNLGILLVDETVGDNNMGYWQKSYDEAFKEDGSVLGSAVQSVGNLLNIKL